jgi:hypothetical protein
MRANQRVFLQLRFSHIDSSPATSCSYFEIVMPWHAEAM